MSTGGCRIPGAALAYPLHGQYKLSNEGYRTRDGHLIEWLGRFATENEAHIDVISRPEPLILARRRRVRGSIAMGTASVETNSFGVPNIANAKSWWIRSARDYPEVGQFGRSPALIWNPFVATAPSRRNPFTGSRVAVLDLLDDWTVHFAFNSIRREVEIAYRRAFDESAAVFANSEATLDLAHRFGRQDAELLLNGVDPGRFAVAPMAAGPLTIGYVGKIGQRLDAQLIEQACTALADVRFVFAGPFVGDIDGKYRRLLSKLSNVELLGDVHYEKVPGLMATFDLGWVPHAVGKFEVGGDVIKTYEYRATGLQVLTTPVIGAGRRFATGVHVVPAGEQVAWLREAIRGHERLERIPGEIPIEFTWRYKASVVAGALGLDFPK